MQVELEPEFEPDGGSAVRANDFYRGCMQLGAQGFCETRSSAHEAELYDASMRNGVARKPTQPGSVKGWLAKVLPAKQGTMTDAERRQLAITAGLASPSANATGHCWWSTVRCTTPPVALSPRGRLQWPLSSRQKGLQRVMAERVQPSPPKQRSPNASAGQTQACSRSTSPTPAVAQHAAVPDNAQLLAKGRPRDYMPCDRLRTPLWRSRDGARNDERARLEHLMLSPRRPIIPPPSSAKALALQLPPLQPWRGRPPSEFGRQWDRGSRLAAVSDAAAAADLECSPPERWRAKLPPHSSALWKQIEPPGGRLFLMGLV